MVTFAYKPVYIVVVFSILFATVEGEELSHSRKCPKRTGKFPIPGSFCTSFYICQNWRVLREESCSMDQHFNPVKGWCDDKELYPCLEKPSRKECPKSNGRFLKNGTDCESYFDCCNGKPTEKKCSEGQLFDAISGKCDWEELVECEGSSKNKDCPKPNGKFLKPGTKCQSYYECCKGKAKEKKCPNYKLFNAKSGRCDWKERVICEEKKNKDCPKPTGRFLKSGTGCKVYFDCYDGRATKKTCPKNELFDSRTGKCDWKDLVTCKDEETSSESSSSESSESNESTRESTPDYKISTPPTSPDTISEDLISDSTTEWVKTPSLITDFTTEKVKSPSPITDSLTKEVETPSPITDSITEEVKMSSSVPDSTTEEVKSPSPITESTSPEVSYSTPDKTVPDLIESTTMDPQSTSPEIMSVSRTQSIFSTPQITVESTPQQITVESTPQQITVESTPQQITVESTPQQTTGESFSRTFTTSTQQIRESTPQQTTKLSTQEISTSPEITEPTSRPTEEEITSGLSTILDLTSTSTEEEILSTESTTESTMEPITRETTVEEIISSTYSPTDNPEDSTFEEILSSYQTEQSSSYGTKETIVVEISTESEQSSSSFKATQTASTDAITKITTEIVDIISSDSTTETISSLATKSETFPSSTFIYQTTIDPVLVGFVCPEQTGYYPHPTNKYKFIGCVHKVAYIMDCPSNLVYNHAKRQCVYDN